MATIDHILNELQRQRRDIDRLRDDTETSTVTTRELLARIADLHARSEQIRQVTLEARPSSQGGEARRERVAAEEDVKSPRR